MKVTKNSDVKRKFQELFMIVTLTPIMVFSIGCGRETTIYPDKAPVTQAATPTPTETTDGRTLLPLTLYDQSVNKGKVDVALDGVSATSSALRFSIAPGSSPAGSYNGSGEGSRAILGIGGQHGKKLSELDELTFDMKIYTGSEALSVALLVDLECNGAEPRVLVAQSSALGPATMQPGGYARYAVALDEKKWKVEGTEIVNPDTSAPIVLSTSQATNAKLTDLTDAYPSACLKNAQVSTDTLPDGLILGAVMLILGDDSTVDASGVYVNRITVGSQVFDEME